MKFYSAFLNFVEQNKHKNYQKTESVEDFLSQLLSVEKKLELIFSKNITKNVRKKSVRKNPYQGKDTDQIRLLRTSRSVL